MPVKQPGAVTTGSSSFDPDVLLSNWSKNIRPLPKDNDLRASIIQTFSLPEDDSYVYHAIASVTLAQAQQAIDHGGKANLHAWYRDGDGKPLDPPPLADIEAYITIFSPSTTPEKALVAFTNNAKKGTTRSEAAAHLRAHRLLPASISIARCRNHVNPALDFWAWSCKCLEWFGPVPGVEKVMMSHHILPIFMHHFGCVTPSYEALEIMRQVAKDRVVLDMGSGNGYWTFMLRRHGLVVEAIDSMQSAWRTVWISDTKVADSVTYLRAGQRGRDGVLLLVYPVVGNDFTKKTIDAYQGSTIVVAGTQNRSGYTAFKDATIDQWMLESKQDFKKVVQSPLPSFAGKDEALFVFEKETVG